MVSYKSVFRAIFRSEHTDDTVVAPPSSKSRQKKPSRAFTVPASPARPKNFIEQPVAGPSTRRSLNPYTNFPNRHSAVALRDLISPRPRLRKNSLPSQFPKERSPLSRATIPTTAEDAHSQDQRLLSASPVPVSLQSDSDEDYPREPHSSLGIGRSGSLDGDSNLRDHLDTSIPTFGVRESSDISLLLSSEPKDARKAISKRLEGLAMALDMFQPIQSTSSTKLPRNPGLTPKGLTKLDTSLDVTHPLITFPLSSKSAAAAFGSTSLSPIENWRDEEGEERHWDEDDIEGDDDEELSYFHIPGSKFSQSSHSSFSVSSSTSDLPPTPGDLPSTVSVDAVQLLPTFLSTSPVAFNLGPVVQSRVVNCKATPTPVVSVDACDGQSGIVRL